MTKKLQIAEAGERIFEDERLGELRSAGAMLILCIMYAAKKVGFQEGKMSKEQMLQCALPYGDPALMTPERVEALRNALVTSNEACWDLLAPARGMLQ